MSPARLLFFSAVVLANVLETLSTDVQVNSNVGNIIGFEDYVMTDGQVKIVTKFLGIPYAETTAGINRFEKPVPKAPFNGTFSAKTFPPKCYAMETDSNDPGFSEDCLALNIYIPRSIQTARKPLPVMIWVYGGSFVLGTSKTYRAEALSAFGDVIVVTINYRLAMFGFLRSNDGRFVGNQGLWDQHLAFKWVHNNIDRFYGDPHNVTIFGESSGGVSVLLHALYPGNDGLFQRVISESGTAFEYWSIYKPNAGKVIAKLACLNGDPVLCMKQKSAHEILSVKWLVNYGPVVDGDFLVESPIDIVFGNNSRSSAARDLFASLDIMTGMCMYDGATYMLNKSPFDQLQSKENVTVTESIFTNTIIPKFIDDLYGVLDQRVKDAVTAAIKFEYTDWNDPTDAEKRRLGVLKMTSEAGSYATQVQTLHGHSRFNKGRSYFYEFAVNASFHQWTNPPSWAPAGSYHGDELPYVFGYVISNVTDQTSPVTFTAAEQQVCRAVMTMWTNFAKSGDPNKPTSLRPFLPVEWPPYTMTSQEYISISESLSANSVGARIHADKMAFWLQYIPNLIQRNTEHPSIVINPLVDLIG